MKKKNNGSEEKTGRGQRTNSSFDCLNKKCSKRNVIDRKR